MLNTVTVIGIFFCVVIGIFYPRWKYAYYRRSREKMPIIFREIMPIIYNLFLLLPGIYIETGIGCMQEIESFQSVSFS